MVGGSRQCSMVLKKLKGKEVKLTLFSDNIIMDVKNCKDSTKQLSEKSEFKYTRTTREIQWYFYKKLQIKILQFHLQ